MAVNVGPVLPVGIQVILSALDSQLIVHPDPPVSVAVNVALPPVHTAPLEGEIANAGSFTTVITAEPLSVGVQPVAYTRLAAVMV